MDLKSLGNYYVWADQKMISAIENLSDDEFNQKHEGLGRRVRELAEHLYVTYVSLYEEPTIETWERLNKQAVAMNRKELLENWIESAKVFTEAMVNDSRTEIEFPIGKEKTIDVDIHNFYLLYTDHQTYHRAQMNSLIKILGKKGVNTDYYSYFASS